MSIGVVAVWIAASVAGADPAGAVGGAKQLVVVKTGAWSAIEGELQRWERAKDGAWARVGAPVAVVVGRGGLGWGRGLHGVAAQPGKKEGDGRSPAGIFRFTGATTHDADLPYKPKLSMVRATAALKCVDDPKSKRYNQITDEGKVAKDWASAEDMLRKDDLYRRTVFVAHNVEPAEAGAGSCIFLHVWRAPKTPTVGCTAMELRALDELIAWIDPATALLVQLPAHEYTERKTAWKLP